MFSGPFPQFFNVLSGKVRGGGAPPAASEQGRGTGRGGGEAALGGEKNEKIKNFEVDLNRLGMG